MSKIMRLPMRLWKRKISAHKGDFGHIFIIAGSARFSGAAVLCANAAMRTGSGLVTIGIPRSINNAVIKIKPPEVMTLPLPDNKNGCLNLEAYKQINDFLGKVDVVVIGPGLSQEAQTKKLILKLVPLIKKPLVLDADALNAIVGRLDVLKTKAGKIRLITPHPKEMASLLGTSSGQVNKSRLFLAKSFAKNYNVTVVLKGHNTVVANSEGLSYVNNTGNPGMATAGSGDVLAGMIAALLGQKLSAFDAAKYAVCLHGLAGDIAAEEKTQLGMVASDIISNIPKAIKKMSPA